MQAFPSLHGPGVGRDVHPETGSQALAVQGFPSSHATAPPGAHTPAWQLSPWVHALPSLHGPAAGAKVQPVSTLQPSAVHGLLSLHTVGGPPWHTPATQVSPLVHGLPSEQGLKFPEYTQPTAPLQESVVHGLASSQFVGPPAIHAPSMHVSPCVQALPSEQGRALGALTQPVASSQRSSVHGLPSLQSAGTWPTHCPS